MNKNTQSDKLRGVLAEIRRDATDLEIFAWAASDGCRRSADDYRVLMLGSTLGTIDRLQQLAGELRATLGGEVQS